MRTVAVIPVKTASQCKQRLSTVLDVHSRQRLVELMLDRVVRAVDGASRIDATYIVTNDRSLVPPGTLQIAEPGTGLNDALAAAAAQLSGHAEAMLILPADIPLITTEDVNRLLDLADSNRMVIASDLSWAGTNALLLAPPALIAPRFGRGSLVAHMRAALDLGVRHVVHESANIARDIDEPRDVTWLLENSNDPVFEFLRHRPAALTG